MEGRWEGTTRPCSEGQGIRICDFTVALGALMGDRVDPPGIRAGAVNKSIMTWSPMGTHTSEPTEEKAFFLPLLHLPFPSFLTLLPFFFLETGSHYIDQGGLDLTVHPSLSLNL